MDVETLNCNGLLKFVFSALLRLSVNIGIGIDWWVRVYNLLKSCCKLQHWLLMKEWSDLKKFTIFLDWSVRLLICKKAVNLAGSTVAFAPPPIGCSLFGTGQEFIESTSRPDLAPDQVLELKLNMFRDL